ncbi:MAG: hypothetical protein HRU17_22770 [Polyangiaceae bacterium]|nr:hypothetical protein [Polyangiaceae bacterium]
MQIKLEAAERLCCYDWPLNIRELKSVFSEFFALADPNEALGVSYLQRNKPQIAGSTDERVTPAPNSPGLSSSIPNRHELESLLSDHAGNVSAAADAVGKPRAQLYRWFKRAGLDPARYRR